MTSMLPRKTALPGRRCFMVACALLSCALAAAPVEHTAPDHPVVLSVNKAVAQAGFFQLTWTTGSDSSRLPAGFQLERAATPDFRGTRTIYRGQDQASAQSGQPNGEYYFRVRAVETAHEGPSRKSPWSNTIRVEVRHHPLGRALGLFGAGALIFVVTIAVMRFGGSAV